MRKTMLFLTVLVLGCWLIFEPAGAQVRRDRKNRGTYISTNGAKAINDCEQIRIDIGDGETLRSQVTQTIPRSAISALQVRSSKYGGIHVRGWKRDEYSITACLAAGGDNANEAKALLAQLKLSVSDGKVRIED